jgi:hypothetical protein
LGATEIGRADNADFPVNVVAGAATACGAKDAYRDGKANSGQAIASVFSALDLFEENIAGDIDINRASYFQLARIKERWIFDIDFPANVFSGAAAVQNIVQHGANLYWFRFMIPFAVAIAVSFAAAAVAVAIAVAIAIAAAVTVIIVVVDRGADGFTFESRCGSRLAFYIAVTTAVAVTMTVAVTIAICCRLFIRPAYSFAGK